MDGMRGLPFLGPAAKAEVDRQVNAHREPVDEAIPRVCVCVRAAVVPGQAKLSPQGPALVARPKARMDRIIGRSSADARGACRIDREDRQEPGYELGSGMPRWRLNR